MKYNNKTTRFHRSKISLSISAALALSTFGAGLTFAQEDEESQIEEVQVTGSRILQRGNYTGANPVQSLNQDDLRRLGINNMGEAMTTQIAQNISNFQPGMTGDLMSLSSSFFVGATLANLRGLNDTSNFGSRTLTLINGRRVVSSSNMSDVVDMNIIPSNLLQRMDVVTGGASAAYGSGAMAGVVNMVLNNRLEGVNLDVDYGVTGEGDGENYHFALSGGQSLFEGRGHVLGGLEWQDQKAIRSCADARDWCGEGRALLGNNSNFVFTPTPENPINPYPQYGDQPANFRASGQRYNQFSPNGTIPVAQSPDATAGYRFTADGTDVETYDLGIRGGATGPGSLVINGDGPPAGTNSSLTSGYERTSVYTHFEYDFTEELQGYVDVNYAHTFSDNIQWPTRGWSCVRFDERSVPPQTGASLPAGTVVTYGQSEILNDPAFGAFGSGWIWQGNGTYDFGTQSWTLTNDYNAEDVEAVPAQRGQGENAYLNTLSPEAVEQLQNASLARGGAGIMQDTSGNNAQNAFGCGGHAGVYKLWGPQMVQSTERETDTGGLTVGLKGTFGETWSWDGYFNTGRTETTSLQLGAQTNWRYAFATDSIIDPRAESPTFGQPVCRVLVEGLPSTQLNGDPFPPDVMKLSEGCRPLNPFGTYTADQEALDYAFRPLVSDGTTTLNVLALNSSGQIWEGFGAGPVSMAAGFEIRQDKVDNAASDGEAYERIDFPFPWSDAYGGKSTIYEEYIEVDVPLLSDLPLIQSFSVNGAVRHATYKNKGGAGTTGASGTQEITNWKFSSTWQPIEPLTLRVTVSRDLRAATYRELYINQPALADSSNTNNLWITRSNEDSDEQRDMMANRTVGNPDLRPETSDTYTAGFVFSPGELFGGVLDGMNLSMDYYQIDIKDGLTSEFGSAVESCWEQSGNVAAEYDTEGTGALIDPGVNGLFDPDNRWCQQLDFGAPNPAFGDNTYSNLTEVRQTFTNREPFQTRGIDISWDYMFSLDALHDSLPGALAMRMTATHALEASTTQQDVFAGTNVYTDVVGQVGNGVGFTFGLPVQPTPEWAGNFSFTWLTGPASLTLSARYVGSGKIDVDSAYGPGEEFYQNAEGEYLEASIDNNNVPSYLNWGLNGSYNLQLFGMEQFQVWGQVNNLFDEEPLFSGGYVGGTNPMFYDTLGRSFKIGVRTRF